MIKAPGSHADRIAQACDRCRSKKVCFPPHLFFSPSFLTFLLFRFVVMVNALTVLNVPLSDLNAKPPTSCPEELSHEATLNPSKIESGNSSLKTQN